MSPDGATQVLVVEDDASIRESLGETLREEGFDVASAANGRQALELLRSSSHPSAILLDLMMPVMDGWDFRHEQLHDPSLRDIPVVIVTAVGFSKETIRTQFGKVEMVEKPVHAFELVKAIDRACRTSLSG
jgi:CheY-like chemotaxis protein